MYIFIFLSMILFLSSCTQYETVYTPPKTEAGMNCVTQCISNKQACSNSCQQKNIAGSVASAAVDIILASKQSGKNNKDDYIHDHSPSNRDCGCTSFYKECYKSCGGIVQKVCIKGCDKELA